MSPLLHDLARHAGQLSLAVLFMLVLTFVLWGEPHISTLFSNALASLAPS
ncbi:hypothetical protein [Cupriavidus agavae]|uniref:Uncharacterized protein n=1 Tax=Cupriavidus agavae TaxID=1001822 RepID=A0A4Q7S8R0_9BURK|nr:hypothetical protein [Cupriavidus agavae]RZT42834.1 hypothetical protein EV147_1878 [Cupriavidus agavae]